MKLIKLVLSLALISLFAFRPVFAEDFADDNTGRDDKKVYHIFEGIDLISQQKVTYDKPRIVIRTVYPELQSADGEAPDHFNQLVQNIVSEEVDHFKSIVVKAANYQQTLPKSKIKNDLTVDYSAATVKSGQNLILSVRFSIQGSATGMAHPYHHYRVINYDLNEERVLELADLFAPDSDYLTKIGDYTRKELLRRLPNKDLIAGGTTPTTQHFKIWNIKSDGLLITFNEYQVAAYVFGPQTIRVPFSILKDIVPADSPIAKCVHKKHCGGNNLLTGGFTN